MLPLQSTPDSMLLDANASGPCDCALGMNWQPSTSILQTNATVCTACITMQQGTHRQT